MATITPITGFANFQVDGKTYQTYYLVFGDLQASTHTPLVALHGGPGFSHHYLLTHRDIYVRTGIPVILYDQTGNGASSHIPDAPTEFWNPDLFIDELENLLLHLGISNNFDLLGQSWGGILASQYAATRAPKGLRRLILVNSPASGSEMIKSFNDLLDKLPEGTAEVVRKAEAEGLLESEEYQAALGVFRQRHICNVAPWPEDLVASFVEFSKDPSVYRALWGTLQFQLTGSLRNWSIIDSLHKISAPTLFISSKDDVIQPAACRAFFTQIPKIKWVDIPGTSHSPMFENPERYFSVVESFLLD